MEEDSLDYVYTELMINNTEENEVLLRETLIDVTSIFSECIFCHKGYIIKPEVYSVIVLDHSSKQLESKKCCKEKYTIICREKYFYKYNDQFWEIKSNYSYCESNNYINKLVNSYYHDIYKATLYKQYVFPFVITV